MTADNLANKDGAPHSFPRTMHLCHSNAEARPSAAAPVANPPALRPILLEPGKLTERQRPGPGRLRKAFAYFMTGLSTR